MSSERDEFQAHEPQTYCPSPPDTCSYVDGGVFTVDGESFRVRQSSDGAFHYDWITGPNKDYGFSLGDGPQLEFSTKQHEDQIRDFLAGIDPATGYLAD